MSVISKVRHPGIVVENLEASIQFYTDLLGLKEIKRGTLEQCEVLHLMGMADSNLTWVFLSTLDLNYSIELYYIHKKELREQYFDFKCEAGFLDFQHFSFLVDDVEKLYEKLSENNVTCLCSPSIDSECKYKIFFVRDIDGYLIEFAQEV